MHTVQAYHKWYIDGADHICLRSIRHAGILIKEEHLSLLISNSVWTSCAIKEGLFTMLTTRKSNSRATALI